MAVLESRMDAIDGLKTTVDAIHQELTRYRGFVGGVLFIGSCLGTFFGVAHNWIMSHWK